MKKEHLVIAITIGVICIIFTFVMTVQLRTVKETDITLIESMREDELTQQLELWKQKYEETENKIQDDKQKIDEYKKKIENNEETTELVQSELAQAKIILGSTDVEGEGIIIKLEDSEQNIISEDLIKLVNELKLAGAEAISINGERIINLSEIVDVNSYVIVNGKRLSSPFEIKAIGNQQYLVSGLSAKGGYIDSIKSNGKKIDVQNQKNLNISKYSGEIKLKTIKLD